MVRTVLLLLFLPVAIVVAAQTASDFAARYGDPHVERFVIRPGITLMVAYGPDKTGCQMIVEPKRSILKNDGQSEVLPKEIVPEVLEEMLPESSGDNLLKTLKSQSAVTDNLSV